MTDCSAHPVIVSPNYLFNALFVKEVGITLRQYNLFLHTKILVFLIILLQFMCLSIYFANLLQIMLLQLYSLALGVPSETHKTEICLIV